MAVEDIYKSLKITDKFMPNSLIVPTIASVTDGAKSTKTFGLTTAAVTVTAADYGEYGDDISVTIVDPEEDADLSVAVTGQDIVVTLEYSDGSTDSTAEEVADAINAATDIVVATFGGDGTGTVLPAAKAELENGADVTKGMIGTLRMKSDASELYLKVAEQTWKKITLAGL